MITELLLVLTLYLILFCIWWRFQHLIKKIADVFCRHVDTSKECIEQHKKREELKSVIDTVRLGHKWTHERADVGSDKIINKTYAEYKQREPNKKGEKTEKALGRHVINLYSTGISWMIKIRDVKKLQQDIENDLIIKDQMASLDFLLVCTFSNFLAHVLVVAHTVSNVDFGSEPEEDGAF